MTDFDATEDEVVFYGTDYPGVLNMVQDERYDPTKPDLPTTDGGAKYVDKTISQVVADQLTQAKAQPNSPVGFITVGDVASMPERLTIHASFKNRLQFITGLLDSSRAGTGRKTRIVCERSATGTFKWRVLFAPGKVRDNLRFEYGGLVQGFQTIPYQGWATRVDAVGRTVSGAKTFFHKGPERDFRAELTPEQIDRFDRAALDALGLAGARWLETGEEPPAALQGAA